MTPTDLLRAGRAKIEATGFARGYEARDAEGTAVGFDSDTAHQWCPSFAIIASAEPTDGPDGLGHPAYFGSAVHAALAALWAGVTGNPLSHTALYDGTEIIGKLSGWSDQVHVGDAEVLAAYDRAIDFAERFAIEHEHAVLRQLNRMTQGSVA